MQPYSIEVAPTAAPMPWSTKGVTLFSLVATAVCGVTAVARMSCHAPAGSAMDFCPRSAAAAPTLLHVHQAQAQSVRPQVQARARVPPVRAAPQFDDEVQQPVEAARPTLQFSHATAAATAASLAMAAPALADSGTTGAVVGILGLLSSVLNFYQLVLFIRIGMTWFPNLDTSTLPWNVIARAADPVLNGTRGLVPPIAGLDFGPTLVLLAFNYVTSSLDSSITQLTGF